jgi:hypothetical protein
LQNPNNRLWPYSFLRSFKDNKKNKEIKGIWVEHKSALEKITFDLWFPEYLHKNKTLNQTISKLFFHNLYHNIAEQRDSFLFVFTRKLHTKNRADDLRIQDQKHSHYFFQNMKRLKRDENIYKSGHVLILKVSIRILHRSFQKVGSLKCKLVCKTTQEKIAWEITLSLWKRETG